MCYICNCFAWTLDLIQRALTFILSCWLACSVCCGLSIAIIAGIAYGYNYCLAEFITLSRYDVRVYMRRGQFFDKPDLLHPMRRSGDENDLFPYNISDYHQEVPLGDDSLSDKWMKDQDTQKYADKLTKYSEKKTFEDFNQQVNIPEISLYYKVTTTPFRRATIVPNRLISTAILHSGSSEIVMRQFETMPDVLSIIKVNDNEGYDYRVKGIKDLNDDVASKETSDEDFDKRVITITPDIRIRVEDRPNRKIKMRHWRTTSKPVIADYSPDVDENAIVYKAIQK